MEIEKIIIAIFVTLIFGFAVFAYVEDFSKDASVTLDENYTRLSGDFEDNIQSMGNLGQSMLDVTETKGGFTVTTVLAIVGQGMYTVAKMPLDTIELTWTLITDAAVVIGIPSIYVGAAVSIITLLFVFGLISLLFRKDV